MNSVNHILDDQKYAIINRWRAEASRAASARGLSAPEFINVLPLYLESLLTVAPAGRERQAHFERHIAARLRQGFDAAEVADELVILGEAINETCGYLPASERPDPNELAALHRTLQLDIASVTRIFTDHLMRDQQLEKRTLRNISELVRAGLARPETLQERLGEVMALVLDAAGAQGAVLMRGDDAGRALLTMAFAGAFGEELRGLVVDVRGDTFLARASSNAEPTEERDLAHASVAIDAPLVAGGLRSLIAFRLPVHDPLVGVLCLGFAEPRTMSAFELGRAEALADHIGHEVKAIELYTTLQRTIGELEVERAARERVVALVAHDLRGPLAAALLSVQLIQRGKERTVKVDELASRAAGGLERMERMIRDLLDANRIHAGEPLPLRIERGDLTSIARDVADELRQLHGDRFRVVADGPVEGYWSADELRRSVWNLAVNAVKYGAPDAPIAITVRDTGLGVEVAVHNEGEAIPAALQRHLFRLASHITTAAANDSPSWGLGLTLVSGVAAAHGGSVRVESSEAVGTTFTITLPKDARAAVPPVAAAG